MQFSDLYPDYIANLSVNDPQAHCENIDLLSRVYMMAMLM